MRILTWLAAGPPGRLHAVIAPHAGLMFSGPVGAFAYKAAAGQQYDVAVLVGPSHFVGFEGVALWPDGAFDTPLGAAMIDEAGARALMAFDVVQPLPQAHRREHSLEMQLPFLRHLFPDVPIVPLLIGYQQRATIEALAAALASAFGTRRALFVASTDLSHYFDAVTAGNAGPSRLRHRRGFRRGGPARPVRGVPRGRARPLGRMRRRRGDRRDDGGTCARCSRWASAEVRAFGRGVGGLRRRRGLPRGGVWSVHGCSLRRRKTHCSTSRGGRSSPRSETSDSNSCHWM